MNVREDANQRTVFEGLTPQEHEAGMDFLAEEPISYEYSVEDRTWIKLIAATAEQKASFEDAIT